MLESDPLHQRHARAIGSVPFRMPQTTFAAVALAVGLVLWAAVSVTFGLGLAGFGAMILLGVTSCVACLGLRHGYPHATLGLANTVTLVRAAMMAFLAGAALAPEFVQTYGWLFFTVAVVAFALDGIDGIIARATGMTSDFGARFDMEIDAALAAVLCLILLRTGTAGAEILVLGFTRYVFVAASFGLPWLAAPLPPRFRRKAICVIQVAALITLLFPLTPTGFVLPVSVAASVALLASFAVDIRWLARAAK